MKTIVTTLAAALLSAAASAGPFDGNPDTYGTILQDLQRFPSGGAMAGSPGVGDRAPANPLALDGRGGV
jgi:hypothetical protein